MQDLRGRPRVSRLTRKADKNREQGSVFKKFWKGSENAMSGKMERRPLPLADVDVTP
jgi:hypothetical protein